MALDQKNNYQFEQFRSYDNQNRIESFNFKHYDKYLNSLEDITTFSDTLLKQTSSQEERTLIIQTEKDDNTSINKIVSFNDMISKKFDPSIASSGKPADDDKSNKKLIGELLKSPVLPDYSYIELKKRQSAYNRYKMRMLRKAGEKAKEEKKLTEIKTFLGISSITIAGISAGLITIGIGIFLVPSLATPFTWVTICSNLTNLFNVQCFVAIFKGFGLFTESESLELVAKFKEVLEEWTTKTVNLPDLLNDIFINNLPTTLLKSKYPEKSIIFFSHIKKIIESSKRDPSKIVPYTDFYTYIQSLYESGYVKAAITALQIGKTAYTFVTTSLDVFKNNPDAEAVLIYKELSKGLLNSYLADSLFQQSSSVLSKSSIGILSTILKDGKVNLYFGDLDLNDKTVQNVLIIGVKDLLKSSTINPINAYFANLQPKKISPPETPKQMMKKIEDEILMRAKYRKDGLSDEDIEMLIDPSKETDEKDRYKLLPVKQIKQFFRKFKMYMKNPSLFVTALSSVYTLNAVLIKIIGGSLTALIIDWKLNLNILRKIPGSVMELVPSGLFHYGFLPNDTSLAWIVSLLITTLTGGDAVIINKIDIWKKKVINDFIYDLNLLITEIYDYLTKIVKEQLTGTRLQKYIDKINDVIFVRLFTKVCNFIFAILKFIFQILGVPFLALEMDKRTPKFDMNVTEFIQNKDKMMLFSTHINNSVYNSIKQFNNLEFKEMFTSVLDCFNFKKAMTRVVSFIDTSNYIKSTAIENELIGTVIELQEPTTLSPSNKNKYIITKFEKGLVTISPLTTGTITPEITNFNSNLFLHYLQDFLKTTGEQLDPYTRILTSSQVDKFKEYLLNQVSYNRNNGYSYFEKVIQELIKETDKTFRTWTFLGRDPRIINSALDLTDLNTVFTEARIFLNTYRRSIEDYAVTASTKTVNLSVLMKDNTDLQIPILRYNFMTGLFDHNVTKISISEYFDIKVLASLTTTKEQYTSIESELIEKQEDSDSIKLTLSYIYAEFKMQFKEFLNTLTTILGRISKSLLDETSLHRLNYLGFNYSEFKKIASTDFKNTLPTDTLDLVKNLLHIKHSCINSSGKKIYIKTFPSKNNVSIDIQTGESIDDSTCKKTLLDQTDVENLLFMPETLSLLLTSNDQKMNILKNVMKDVTQNLNKLLIQTINNMNTTAEEVAVTNALKNKTPEAEAAKAAKTIAEEAKAKAQSAKAKATENLVKAETAEKIAKLAKEKAELAKVAELAALAAELEKAEVAAKALEAEKLALAAELEKAKAEAVAEEAEKARAMEEAALAAQFEAEAVVHIAIGALTKNIPLNIQNLKRLMELVKHIEDSEYLKTVLQPSLLTFLKPSYLKNPLTDRILDTFYLQLQDKKNKLQEYLLLHKKKEQDIKNGVDNTTDLCDFLNTESYSHKLVSNTPISDIDSYFKSESELKLKQDFINLDDTLKNTLSALLGNKNCISSSAKLNEYIQLKKEWFVLNEKMLKVYREKRSLNKLNEFLSNLSTHYSETEVLLRELQTKIRDVYRRNINSNNWGNRSNPDQAPPSDIDPRSSSRNSSRTGYTTGQMTAEQAAQFQNSAQQQRQDVAQAQKEKQELEQSQATDTSLEEELESETAEAVKEELGLATMLANMFSNMIDGLSNFFSKTSPRIPPINPTVPVETPESEIKAETSEEACRRIKNKWGSMLHDVSVEPDITKAEAYGCRDKNLMHQFSKDAMSYIIATIQVGIETLALILGYIPALNYISPILQIIKTGTLCLPVIINGFASSYIEKYGNENNPPDILVSLFGAYLIHSMDTTNTWNVPNVTCEGIASYFHIPNSQAIKLWVDNKLIKNMRTDPKYNNLDPTKHNYYGHINKGHKKTTEELMIDIIQLSNSLSRSELKNIEKIELKITNNNPLDCQDYQLFTSNKMFLYFIFKPINFIHIGKYIKEYIYCSIFNNIDPFSFLTQTGQQQWWHSIPGAQTLAYAINRITNIPPLFVRAIINGIPFMIKLITEIICEVLFLPNLRSYVLDELLGQPSNIDSGGKNINVGRDIVDKFFKPTLTKIDEAHNDPQKLAQIYSDFKTDILKSLTNMAELLLNYYFIEKFCGYLYKKGALRDSWIDWLKLNCPGYDWERARTAAPSSSTTQKPQVLTKYDNDKNNRVIGTPEFLKELFCDIEQLEVQSKLLDSNKLTPAELSVANHICINLDSIKYAKQNMPIITAIKEKIRNSISVDFSGEYADVITHWIDLQTALNNNMTDFYNKIRSDKLIAFTTAIETKDNKKTGGAISRCDNNKHTILVNSEFQCIEGKEKDDGYIKNNEKIKLEKFFKSSSITESCISLDDVIKSLLIATSENMLPNNSIFMLIFIPDGDFKKSMIDLIPADVKQNEKYTEYTTNCLSKITAENINEVKSKMLSQINSEDNFTQFKNEYIKSFILKQMNDLNIQSDINYCTYLYMEYFNIELIGFSEVYGLYDLFKNTSTESFDKKHNRMTGNKISIDNTNFYKMINQQNFKNMILNRLTNILLKNEYPFLIRLPDKFFNDDQPFFVKLGHTTFDLRDELERKDYLKQKSGNTHTYTDDVDFNKLNESGFFIFAGEYEHPTTKTVEIITQVSSVINNGAQDKKYTPKTSNKVPPPILLTNPSTWCGHWSLGSPKLDSLNCINDYIKNNKTPRNATFDYILALYNPHQLKPNGPIMYVLKADEQYYKRLLEEFDKSTNFTVDKLLQQTYNQIYDYNDWKKNAVEAMKSLWKKWTIYLPFHRELSNLSRNMIHSKTGNEPIFKKYPYLIDRIGFSITDQRSFGMAYDDDQNDIFTNIEKSELIDYKIIHRVD